MSKLEGKQIMKHESLKGGQGWRLEEVAGSGPWLVEPFSLVES